MWHGLNAAAWMFLVHLWKYHAWRIITSISWWCWMTSLQRSLCLHEMWLMEACSLYENATSESCNRRNLVAKCHEQAGYQEPNQWRIWAVVLRHSVQGSRLQISWWWKFFALHLGCGCVVCQSGLWCLDHSCWCMHGHRGLSCLFCICCHHLHDWSIDLSFKIGHTDKKGGAQQCSVTKNVFRLLMLFLENAHAFIIRITTQSQDQKSQ